MIFSNNEEYNEDTVVPISGAFYCTTSKDKAFFSTFREEDRELLLKVGYKYEVPEDIEKEMKEAAKKLDFERAMELRDILFELKSK